MNIETVFAQRVCALREVAPVALPNFHVRTQIKFERPSIARLGM